MKAIGLLNFLYFEFFRCVSTSGESKNVLVTIHDTCGRSYAQCRDESCIPVSQLCDGIAQCRDHSDEDPKFCGSKPFHIIIYC